MCGGLVVATATWWDYQEFRAWVNWFNNQRLLEPIGNIPPAELEANYYASLAPMKQAA
jgi:transposase InsO family protein